MNIKNNYKDKIYKNRKIIYILTILFTIVFFVLPLLTRITVKENKVYESKKEISLYLYKYNHLPKNFMTKTQIDKIYVDKYKAIHFGVSVGGDIFKYNDCITNYTTNTNLRECDIYSNRNQIYENRNRGRERLVYSIDSKGKIIEVFYTSTHYKGIELGCANSFYKISKWRINYFSNLCWIIFIIYMGCEIIFYILIIKTKITSLDEIKKDLKEIYNNLIKRLKTIFINHHGN